MKETLVSCLKRHEQMEKELIKNECELNKDGIPVMNEDTYDKLLDIQASRTLAVLEFIDHPNNESL
ncbi:MAG: hypothetical protein HOG49_13140 [Candidatus Scalindua sp.]|nr:hypothetical protein [Candidatus Scalindua sp.]